MTGNLSYTRADRVPLATEESGACFGNETYTALPPLRAKGIKEDTILDWLLAAARQAAEVEEALLKD